MIRKQCRSNREPIILLANLRRARTFAIAITAISLGALLIGAITVSAGLKIEGAWIAVATFIVGMFGLGVFMLSRAIRVRRHPFVQALQQSPTAISDLCFLRRETYCCGQKIVAYTYLIVRMYPNRRYELWIQSAELDGVIAEIRELAPQIPINPHIQVERLNVPL